VAHLRAHQGRTCGAEASGSKFGNPINIREAGDKGRATLAVSADEHAQRTASGASDRQKRGLDHARGNPPRAQ